MMAQLKYIDPISLAKVLAVIYLIIGFVIGLVFAALTSLGALIPGNGAFAIMFGVAAIVVFPILYAVIGFVGGAILAIIYNFVASRIGGVKVILK